MNVAQAQSKITKLSFGLVLVFASISCGMKDSESSSEAKTIHELTVKRNQKDIGDIIAALINKRLTRERFSPEQKQDIGIINKNFIQMDLQNNLYTRKHLGVMLSHSIQQSLLYMTSILRDTSISDLYDEKVLYWKDDKGREHAAALQFYKSLASEPRLFITLKQIWVTRSGHSQLNIAGQSNYDEAIYYYEKSDNDKGRILYSGGYDKYGKVVLSSQP